MLKKTLCAATASAIFVVVLIVVYVLHVRFFRVDVLFYSAILDGAIATLLTGAVLFLWPPMSILGSFEKPLLCLVWILSGYAFAISVPTVIDRSLSIYILEKIQQRGGGIKLSSFEDVFTKEYVKEHRLVDIRLTEQRASGTISIRNGCVLLTPRGEAVASMSRLFRHYFLPRHRLLMGDYSDVLTDPFRSSEKVDDYACN